jgi:hypothetical protein
MAGVEVNKGINLESPLSTERITKMDDTKISRHKCGAWLYAGNACEVCKKRGSETR